MKKKTGSEIICENFKIPHQTIFQDYKCSYKSGLTYFGRIYIGQQNVLFIANMFGIIKKCIISIENIKKVEQPTINSISITQSSISNDVEYVFSGLKNNHAYILIKALWKRQKIESEVLKSHDEDENIIIDQIQKAANRQKLIDQGNVESSFFNPNITQNERQKICQFQLPCSVDQYFAFFLADKAEVYSRRKHLELKDSKQITITQWKKSEELQSQVRQVAALIRVFGVPFMNYAHLNQVWKLKRLQNELLVEIVTQMSDIPYSNYFVVNIFIKVEKDGETKCKMTVDVSIVLCKSTYMRKTIISRTLADMKEDFQFWFDKVKNQLNKMRASNKISSKKHLKHSQSAIQMEYESNTSLNQGDHIQQKTHMQSKITKGEYKQIITSIQKKVNNLYRIILILVLINLLQLALQLVGARSQTPSNQKLIKQNEFQNSLDQASQGSQL